MSCAGSAGRGPRRSAIASCQSLRASASSRASREARLCAGLRRDLAGDDRVVVAERLGALARRTRGGRVVVVATRRPSRRARARHRSRRRRRAHRRAASTPARSSDRPRRRASTARRRGSPSRISRASRRELVAARSRARDRGSLRGVRRGLLRAASGSRSPRCASSGEQHRRILGVRRARAAISASRSAAAAASASALRGLRLGAGDHDARHRPRRDAGIARPRLKALVVVVGLLDLVVAGPLRSTPP